MARLSKLLAVTLALVLMLGGGISAGAQEDPTIEKALEWVKSVFEERTEDAMAQMDDTLREAVEAQGGPAALTAIMEAYGDVIAYGEPQMLQSGDYWVVMIPMEFESGNFAAQVAVDDAGKIGGIYFFAAEEGAAEPPAEDEAAADVPEPPEAGPNDEPAPPEAGPTDEPAPLEAGPKDDKPVPPVDPAADVPPVEPLTADEAIDIALANLQAIVAGDYAQVEAVFTPEMMEAVHTSGGLAAVMTAIQAQAGEITGLGTPVATESFGHIAVVIPLAVEEGELNATFVIDNDRKIAGLAIQPGQPEVEAAQVPQGVSEEEVTVDAGTGYPLGGTLCIPDGEGPRPAALLVQGSGQNARDEIVGANRVFAQLAHGLAERDIITLRYDKRTYTYPEQWNERGFTVDQEYTEDVLAALALLKADPRVDADQVYIIGHSQGAMLAPRFVASGADVAGLVLMAGSPRTLSALLSDQQRHSLTAAADQMTPEQLEQTEAQYKAWSEEAQAVYKDMDEAEILDHPGLYSGAFPAYYLYDMQRYDALTLLTEQETPVLILQGANDWQVYAMVDFVLYSQALADEPFAQLKLYEGLNHLFMPSVARSITAAVAEYNTPAQIPAQVLNDIATFIAGTEAQ